MTYVSIKRQKMRQETISSQNKAYIRGFLLGTPRLFIGEKAGGEAASGKKLSKKARALLFYLMTTARSHTRDSLTLLLWPEMTDSRARNNLRTTLSELNRVLPEQITNTTDVVTLPANSYWVDVAEFRRALTVQQLPAKKLMTLQQAIALYEGDFLQSFRVRSANAFEDWITQERKQLQLLLTAGLSELLEHAVATDNYPVGITAAQQLLAVEPWLESVHLQLMRLLVQSGQPAQALLQFESCRQILQQKFNLDPGAEITAFAHAIRNWGKGHNIREGNPELHQHLARARTNGKTDNAGGEKDGNNESNGTIRHLPTTEYPLNTIPTNFITPLATLIGRTKELDFVCQKLADQSCRLLTITGPGGIGKTRLAEAVGERLLQMADPNFPDGMFWVSLADISINNIDQVNPVETAVQPPATLSLHSTLPQISSLQTPSSDTGTGELILQAIANQLGSQQLVRPSSAQQLHIYLRTRRLLLILDNFEHLLAGTSAIVTLLTQAPNVKVLVTSRVRLNVRGEQILVLPCLSLPTTQEHDSQAWNQQDRIHDRTVLPTLNDLPAVAAQNPPANGTAAATASAHVSWQESQAVAMFVQRAQLLDPWFALTAETAAPVIQICQLVAGLPLGIELAATMLVELPCEKLATELATGLDILTADLHDLPQEHRTLGTVFERSWRLLPAEAQRLLASLAVFPGSFSRDALEEIADGSSATLKCLIDHSLVNRVGAERYGLHRTIQTFAMRKLQLWPEQRARMYDRYIHFYLTLVAELEQRLFGADYAAASTQLTAELDNIHTAWRWAVNGHMYQLLNRCLNALTFFYEQYGFHLEIFTLYEQTLAALDGADSNTHVAEKVKSHKFVKKVAPIPPEDLDESNSNEHQKSTTTGSETFTEQAAVLAMQRASTSLEAECNRLVGRLQTHLACYHIRLGRLQEVPALFEASWSRLAQGSDPAAAAFCLTAWAGWMKATNPPQADALLAEALHLINAEDATWLETLVHQVHGESGLLSGRYAEAETHISTGLQLATQMQWARSMVVGHKDLARIYLFRGDYRQAEEELYTALALAQQHHFLTFSVECTMMLSETYRLQRQYRAAASSLEQCDKLADEFGVTHMFVAVLSWEEGCLAEQQDKHDKAKACFFQSLDLGMPSWWAHATSALGWAHFGLGELTEAEEYFERILTDAVAQHRFPVSLDAHAGLAAIAIQQNKAKLVAVPPHQAEGTPVSQLRNIYRDPATMQATRDRIIRLASEQGIELTE